MKKTPFVLRSLVIALATVSSSSLFAAGFQLNGQSATGLGRAFAGDAVIADNAAVMARNPAAISLFDRPEISLGVVLVDSAPEVKDTTYTTTTALGSQSVRLADVEVGDLTPVPNIYYVHPINKQLVLAAGVFSNFGTATEFGNDYQAGLFFGGKTELTSVNVGFTASYRLTEQLSLGAGIDLVQGSGTLIRASGDATTLDLEAAGIDFGWNIGAVYEINDDHRFGLSYRYSPEVNAEIDAGSIFAGQPLTGDLIIRLPDIAEFSGYHALDSKFAVHYSIQWIGWDAFDSLETTDLPAPLNVYNWQNGWHFSLGGTYHVNDQLTLRAGYMHDTSAQDKITSISVPDSDRNWLSAGLSYAFTPRSTFDFGLTYLMGEDVKVNEETTTSLPQVGLTTFAVDATTRANAWLYGVQYTYKF